MVNLKGQKEPVVWVTVSNLTCQTVVIPPSAVLEGLQEEEIEEMPELEEAEKFCDDAAKVDLSLTEENLTTDQFREFKAKLQAWDSLFAKDDLDLGHTDAIKHNIKLTDNNPFKQRFWRIPPSMFQKLQQHLQQTLDCGVIRTSHSPGASNIVLVKKKDGKLRSLIEPKNSQRCICNPKDGGYP